MANGDFVSSVAIIDSGDLGRGTGYRIAHSSTATVYVFDG